MTTLARRVAAAGMLGICAAAAGLGACERADPLGAPQQPTGAGAGTGEGGGTFLPPDDGGPPPLDASGLCGNQLHEVVVDAPNVYFVIDASGSMSAPAGNKTRYQKVRSAAVDLVRELGALIHVGAALFPHEATSSEECAIGAQVMEVTPGDPYTGQTGPTTGKFSKATDVTPFGGTPTAATLDDLRPGIQSLPGKTIVVLVTDGAPNCNDDLLCGPNECPFNIEGCTGDPCCEEGENCCAPGAPAGPGACIDELASIQAVEAYAEAGLPVYVVGIPGSEIYAGVLGDMAIAAGTAQIAAPFYFSVESLDNLGAVLGGIAAIAVSCVFQIEDPPETPDETNVYLDGQVLPADLENGWRWMDPDLTRIELLGDACDRLKSAQIKSVQIVSGCPTEPPK